MALYKDACPSLIKIDNWIKSYYRLRREFIITIEFYY